MVPYVDMPDTMSGDENLGSTDVVELKVTRDLQGTHSLDSVFDILRSSRRRYLLYYLYGTEDQEVSLEAAINGVREFEAAGPETATIETRQSVRTNLSHEDLPKLGAIGALEYDARSGTILFTGDYLLRDLLEVGSHLELE